MSYQNENDNEYGEYFSALEKSIEKQKNSSPVEKPQNNVPRKSGKRRKRKMRKSIKAAALAAIVLVAAILTVLIVNPFGKHEEKPVKSVKKDQPKVVEETPDLFAKSDKNTLEVDTDVVGECVVFIDGATNKIVAKRNENNRCFPASTTKIMTLLVAVETAKSLDDTFTFSYAVTDPLYRAGATFAGFGAGETVDITDMLYGLILPSGADAAAGLAIKIAGSEAAFVDLMNKKVKELGLKNTHFENATGLHGQNHYSTPYDMAVILRAACQNELCKQVLSTYQYTTKPTAQHPNGILLTSTLFSYMYGTEPENAVITGGKTGYTAEAGYCIASFGQNAAESEVFCVCFKSPSKWPAVYDQIKLYTKYANTVG